MLSAEVNSCRKNIPETSENERIAFVEHLISLLQVKLNTEEKAKKVNSFIEYMFSSCLSDLKRFKLAELAIGYEMALNGKLTLENKRIEIFPELSNITFSKIVQALVYYKQNDETYLNAKQSLLSIKTEEEIETEKKEEKTKILSFWKNCFQFILEVGFHRSAWVLYDRLVVEGKLKVDPDAKKNKYKEVSEDYKKELSQLSIDKKQSSDALEYKSYLINNKKILDQIENRTSGYVIETCKSFFVCEYLNSNKITENDFLKLVYTSEIKLFEDIKKNLIDFYNYKDMTIEKDSGIVTHNALQKGKITVSSTGKFTFIERV